MGGKLFLVDTSTPKSAAVAKNALYCWCAISLDWLPPKKSSSKWCNPGTGYLGIANKHGCCVIMQNNNASANDWKIAGMDARPNGPLQSKTYLLSHLMPSNGIASSFNLSCLYAFARSDFHSQAFGPKADIHVTICLNDM